MTEMVALPGDPATLAKYAKNYQRIATQLINASNDLRSVANDGVFLSLAINEIRNDAEEASHDARYIYLRYTGAADALATYSIKLRDAQDRANRAIGANVSADVDVYDLSERRELYEQYAREPGPDQEDWVRRLAVVEDDLATAQANSRNSWSEYNAAVDDRNRAAQEAIEAIRLAEEASGVNDTLWDDAVGVARTVYLWAQENVTPILEALRPILETLADVLSVLAFIATLLSFIPGVAIVATVLTVAALVMSALAVLCTAFLFALGRETLGNYIGAYLKFAISAVMLVAGGGLVAKGIGKVLGHMPVVLGNASILHVQVLGIALSKATEATAESVLGAGVDASVSAVAGIGETKVVLFESTSSGDWNPPPTIPVDDFVMPQSISELENLRSPVPEGSVSVCR